ncbi:MAG: NF038122 family metalloprotease, partial [Blastocatellia bacterium]
MKRLACYAVAGMRSALFLTMLGCLLVAGLASTILQPASAARFGAQPGAAPQSYVPQIQKPRAAEPAAKAQDHLRGAPLEGGSVLELRDGQVACRAATEAEAHAMQRNHDQELRALNDEAFSPNSPEQTQKGLKIILRGTPQLEQFPEAQAAFLRAARAWEALIQNPITVVIDVDFGPTHFGTPFREDEYGKPRFQWDFRANLYPVIRSALIRSAGSPQEATIYNALPAEQLPTDLGAATTMTYHVAAMRALGLLPPVADPERENLGLPPTIAFNSNTDFDFDPSDGIRPKRYDFNAAALHEIG